MVVVVVGGGGGGGGLESKLSDQLWLSFSLALAKPNNTIQLEGVALDSASPLPTVRFLCCLQVP